MSLNHGINTYQADTNFSAVTTAAVGIPFFVGAWPCHQAGGFVGKPQMATTISEVKELGGYSTEWRTALKPKWSLCQAANAFFVLSAMSPAIFYNVYDPSKHKTKQESQSANIVDHAITLTGDAINDSDLKVTVDEGTELEKGTDYDVLYDDGKCIISFTENGKGYSASTATLDYNVAAPDTITNKDIEAGIEKIEECKALFGIVPDLICCPGWSQTPSVAAVMAAKAGSINGLFRGKAVVDIDTTAAKSYQNVLEWKNANGYTDENMIVCWPMVKSGEDIYDYSAVLCGLMASIDQENGDCPYESPSNKSLPISGACDINGNDISLSIQQADVVSYSAGVVTALNFDGWVAWGNYTGCWPGSSDVAKYFICCSRMMDFLCNTFVNSFWSYVDRPLTPVLIDAVVNSFNTYLNGLTHDGNLYGGEIQYIADNNPTAELIAGKFRLDTRMASPVPAQQIDMYCEYDVNLLTEAFGS